MCVCLFKKPIGSQIRFPINSLQNRPTYSISLGISFGFSKSDTGTFGMRMLVKTVYVAVMFLLTLVSLFCKIFSTMIEASRITSQIDRHTF